MGGGRAGVFSIILLLWIGIAPAGAQVVAPELQGVLRGAAPEELFSVLVTFDREETIVSLAREAGRKGRGEIVRTLLLRAERSQSAVRSLLHAKGKPFRDLWIINGIALEATPELIELLAERPEVAEIRQDGVVHLPDLQAAHAHEGFWNLEAVGAPELWERGIDGAGIVIAVLDSGVDVNHPDLAGRWRGGENSWFNPYAATCTPQTCTPCERNADLPCDDPSGHGTAVVGLIVGGDSSGTPIGVAPGARWIAAKVFRDDGTANFSVIHSAFQWILASDAPPHIVNNSWGLGPAGTCNDEFLPSIRALQEAGIAVVSAAGNNGPGASTGLSPAIYAEGLGAGAVDRNLELAPFSGRGPGACDNSIFPDVTAPGVMVLSAGADSASPFVFVSGTSFAAPHLSGILALLRQGFPEKPIRQLERAVLASATDLGSVGPDNGFGMGLIDARGAWNWLENPPTPLLITPRAAFVPFGSVPPGDSVQREVSFFNAGEQMLPFELNAAPRPFAFVDSNCPSVLSPGEECRATVGFAPDALGLFSGRLDVRYPAGDILDTVFLEGIGNTPPRPAQLIAPREGATVGTTVTFRWNTPPDPDGHPVTDTLVVSRSVEFPDNLADAAGGDRGNPLLAGAGALLFALGAVHLLRRGGKGLGALLIAAALITMVACGGGSTERLPDGSEVTERTFSPGIYFWKVLTEDELGEAASSEVRTFTVTVQ